MVEDRAEHAIRTQASTARFTSSEGSIPFHDQQRTVGHRREQMRVREERDRLGVDDDPSKTRVPPAAAGASGRT